MKIKKNTGNTKLLARNIKQSEYINFSNKSQCKSIDNLEIHKNQRIYSNSKIMRFSTCTHCLKTFKGTDKVPITHKHSNYKETPVVTTTVTLKDMNSMYSTISFPSHVKLKHPYTNHYAKQTQHQVPTQYNPTPEDRLNKTCSTHTSVTITLKKRNWRNTHKCPCCTNEYPFKQSLIEHINHHHPQRK